MIAIPDASLIRSGVVYFVGVGVQPQGDVAERLGHQVVLIFCE